MHKAVAEGAELGPAQMLGHNISDLLLRVAVDHFYLPKLDELANAAILDVHMLHPLVICGVVAVCSAPMLSSFIIVGNSSL